MAGKMQFLSDLALGWFIYTPEGQKTAKKLIGQMGKMVETEVKKFTENKVEGETTNGNTENTVREVRKDF